MSYTASDVTNTVFDFAFRETSALPAAVASIIGCGSNSSGCCSRDVTEAWCFMISHHLILFDEMKTAVATKTVRDLFVGCVEQFSRPCPVWGRIDMLRQMAEKIAKHELPTELFDVSYTSATEDDQGSDQEARGWQRRDEDAANRRHQRLQSALAAKSKGNGFFTKGLMDEALYSYDEAIRKLTSSDAVVSADDGEAPLRGGGGAAEGGGVIVPKHFWKDVAVIHSNRSQCFLNKLNWGEARRAASTALQFDSTNEKAHHRKDLAVQGLNSKLSEIERASRVDALKEQCAHQ